MKKTLLLLFLSSIPFVQLQAQSVQQLELNRLRVRMVSNGRLAPSSSSGTISMNDVASQKLAYAAGLWIHAPRVEGVPFLAAHMYDTGTSMDFRPGPLTTDGSASITPDVSAQYDQVWRVHGNEVGLHHAYFQCQLDPECDTDLHFPQGHTIPNSILNWPAHGDLALSQSPYLGPFHDLDQDGVYNPVNGDHPCLPGDQALYAIFNDNGGPHTISMGDPMGLEIHMTTFAYHPTEAMLNNTVFVHYRIINRRNATYPGLSIGNYADLDLGCPNDDLIGTDIGRNMIYVHNATNDDAPCLGSNGFGQQPPAFGMVLLKGPRMDPNETDDLQQNTLPAYNGSGFGDGIADNERHGMSRSVYFNREGWQMMTDPNTVSGFAGYMNGRWKNNLPFSYGGTGYSEDPGATPTRYVFPGNSDPHGLSTFQGVLPPWTAPYVPSNPDPRAVLITGPITLEAGEEQEILIAYVYARSESGGVPASIAALQQRVDSVHAFAATIPGIMAPGTACDDALLGVGIKEHDMGHMRAYPNPVLDRLQVELPAGSNGGHIQIFDARGLLVQEERMVGGLTTIDVTALAPGLYQMRLVDGTVQRTGRFIKGL